MVEPAVQSTTHLLRERAGDRGLEICLRRSIEEEQMMAPGVALAPPLRIQDAADVKTSLSRKEP